MAEVEAKKPRLEWLDALRGFTMILVVANHVLGLGFGMAPNVFVSGAHIACIIFVCPIAARHRSSSYHKIQKDAAKVQKFCKLCKLYVINFCYKYAERPPELSGLSLS